MTVFPSPYLAYNRNSTFLPPPSPPLPPPSPSRSSPTLAHNLYYDRGAHIINLIKRSALKIVLLVRQLLTAAACLPACPPHLSSLPVPLAVSPLRFPRLYSFPLRIFVASPRSFLSVSLFLSLALSLSLSLLFFLFFFPTEASNCAIEAKKEDKRVRRSRIERFVNALLRRVLFFFFSWLYCS